MMSDPAPNETAPNDAELERRRTPAVELRRKISGLLLRYHNEEVLQFGHEIFSLPKPGGDSRGQVVKFYKTSAFT